jgi:hypothetical protein
LNGLSGRDGQTGPQGVPGVAGARGPKGDTATVLPLVVALPGARISLTSSAHTILKLFLTDGARVTVRITRGSKAVRMVTAKFKAYGRKSIDLRRIKRGVYRIIVLAQDDTQTSVDRATIVVQ